MNLTLYFRLIIMSIFQTGVVSEKKGRGQELMCYDNTFFFCPRVFAKDGFNVSLQVKHGNYCSSENGYRTLGHTMKEVKFGFPSENEELMFNYSEIYGQSHSDYNENGDYVDVPFDVKNFNVCGSVGRIPVSVMEIVFEKHGGIDWNATINKDTFNQYTKI